MFKKDVFISALSYSKTTLFQNGTYYVIVK